MEGRAVKTRILLAVGWGLLLLPAPAAADAVSIGALGDSLTDPYARYTGDHNPQTGMPFWGAAGDKNWAEQFKCARGDRLSVQNFARAGVTSGEMLAQWQ